MKELSAEAASYRQQRLDEVRKVKEALVSAGFVVKRVGHGKGTAYGWMEISVVGPFRSEPYRKILQIAREASGRTALGAEWISVTFLSAESVA